MNVLRFTDLIAAGKVAGQPRLHPCRPQRAAGRQPATSPRTPAFAPACTLHRAWRSKAGAAVMVTSHLGRPTEGEFKPEDSLAPGRQAHGRTARPRGEAGLELGRWRSGRTRRGGDARELPPQQGREEEQRGAGEARWRRCATSSFTTPSARRTAPRPRPTASRSSPRSPVPARCWPPRSMRSPRRWPTRSARWWRSSPAARSATKLTILQSLAKNVDQLIVGGGIANTFMLAAGLPIGNSLAEKDLLNDAKAVIEAMKARGAAVPIPVDDGGHRQGLQGRRDGDGQGGDGMSRPTTSFSTSARRLRRCWPRSSSEGRHHRLERAGGRVRVRCLLQGGTEADRIARHRSDSSAFSIAGGGDTLAAIAKYGIEKQVGYISTGGGAFLEVLEGKTLPAFEILARRAAGMTVSCRHGRRGRRAVADFDNSATPDPSGDRPMPRATKIVATLGPASSSPEVLEQHDARRGVDVVRLNFSHGKAQDHIDRATLVREVAAARRQGGRHHGRPAGPEDPRRQVRWRLQAVLQAGQSVRARCERPANSATTSGWGWTTRTCRAT